MKTQKEIEELHRELTIEIADKDTTPQRRKYLQSAVEVLNFILYTKNRYSVSIGNGGNHLTPSNPIGLPQVAER